jgi:hypothetical protein
MGLEMVVLNYPPARAAFGKRKADDNDFIQCATAAGMVKLDDGFCSSRCYITSRQ